MKTTDALDKVMEHLQNIADLCTKQTVTSQTMAIGTEVQAAARVIEEVWPRWEKVDLFKMPLKEAQDYLALLEREKKLVPFLKERYPKYVAADGSPYSITLASDLGFFGKPGTGEEA